MKKKLVSLLSLILAVVMVFPVAVFAEETTQQNTLEDFKLTAGNEDVTDDTIQLFTNSSTRGSITLKVPDGYDVMWNSDARDVATVVDGVVTAVATEEGEATISAINTQDLTQIVSCTIKVTPRMCTGVQVSGKYQTDYVSGQTFNTTNMTVEAKYNDTNAFAKVTNYTIEPNRPLTAADTSVRVVVDGVKSDPINITVAEKTVSSVDVNASKTAFKANEKITGVTLTVTYNDGDSITLADGFDMTIDGASADRALTTADNGKDVVVSWGGKSDSFKITVTSASTPVVSDKKYTVSGTPTTKTYKVGDKFNASGITVKISKGSETLATLEKDILSAYINYTFVEADAGKTEKEFTFTYDEDITVKVKVTGLSISNSLDDREVEEITAVRMAEDEYWVGHRFTLEDIYEITVEFDGESRDRDIDGDELEDYEFAQAANGFSLEILNANGNRKSSSYRTLIQQSDVQTDSSGKKFIEMRLNYRNENDKADYFEFTVEIGEPDISFYYDDDLIAVYDDLEDALDYTITDDEDWEEFELDDVGKRESITLKLGKDFTIASNFEEFSPEHNVIIDLNGHNLVFYSDTILVDKDDKDYSVTITNSAKTNATFKYSDKSITITLGEDDEFKFEYGSDEDNLPGIVNVSVEVGANGKVSASPALKNNSVDVGMGSDVKFTITPNSGYAVDVVKAGTKTVATTNNSNYSISSSGVVTYTLADVEANTKVSVTFKQVKAEWKNPFSDVKSSSSYYDAVEFVYTNKLFNGITTSTFGPNEKMNRAMFVTVLGRLAGIDEDEAISKYGTNSSFPDITYNKDTKWYVSYVEWAVENGIIVGRDDGTFDPYDSVTKQEMYVMMYRYAVYVEHKQINLNGVSLTASDRGDVKDWAINEVKYAHQQDYLVLSGTKIEPEEYAVRWELARLLKDFSANVLGWAD